MTSNHPPAESWEEKIRNDYVGILSPEQIEATIEYWRKFISSQITQAKGEMIEVLINYLKDFKESNDSKTKKG